MNEFVKRKDNKKSGERDEVYRDEGRKDENLSNYHKYKKCKFLVVNYQKCKKL
jgi:hypothetical protein